MGPHLPAKFSDLQFLVLSEAQQTTDFVRSDLIKIWSAELCWCTALNFSTLLLMLAIFCLTSWASSVSQYSRGLKASYAKLLWRTCRKSWAKGIAAMNLSLPKKIICFNPWTIWLTIVQCSSKLGIFILGKTNEDQIRLRRVRIQWSFLSGDNFKQMFEILKTAYDSLRHYQKLWNERINIFKSQMIPKVIK